MASVNKLFNANVYRGATSLVGRAAEIELPTLEVNLEEHKALGMVGTLQLPAGLKELSVKIKWAGLYADLAAAGANPYAAQQWQVRGSLETYGPGGRVAETPVAWFLTASWGKAGNKVEPHKSSSHDDELAASYVRVNIGGVDRYEIDVYNNIWRAGGLDVIAGFRAAAGI